MVLKKMNILIITSAFPRDNTDSQGIIIAKLVKSLSNIGVTVYVLAPHHSDIPFIYLLEGIKVFRTPYFFPFRMETLSLAPGIYYHLRNSIFAKIQLIFLILSEIFAIILICKRERIDIIHSHWILPHGLPGMIAGYLLSIPHLCSVHGTDVTITKTYPPLIHIVRFIAHRCSYLSTNSRYTQSIIESISTNNPELKLIPMGVDPIEDLSNQSRGNPQGKKEEIILFVGRLIQWKGVHILISAMNKVKESNPNVQLYIIGDGIYLNHLRELVSHLNLENNVFFLGRIPDGDLSNWYQKASVFVLPSIMIDNQTEGLGVVLLEAMAFGLPVIGSNIGGIPDIIENNVNGLLVPPGDPDALADAIIWILGNPEQVEKFRNAGIERINTDFNWSIIAERFIDIYQRIMLPLK